MTRRSSSTADGTTGASDVVVERLTPDEAFGLVAHETRFAVLRALNEADGPLPFDELRTRVGVDDPGSATTTSESSSAPVRRETDAATLGLQPPSEP